MDNSKERNTDLLQTAKYFFNNISMCFGSETPKDRAFIAIVLDGEDAETALVGKKDIISKSIAAAMADDTDMRDVIVEACKAYAAYSLVEKFGGRHE